MRRGLIAILVATMLSSNIFVIAKANSREVKSESTIVLEKGNFKTIGETEEADDDEITYEVKERAKTINRSRIFEDAEREREIKLSPQITIYDKNLKWADELDLTNNPKSIVMHHIEASRGNGTIPVEDVHSWHLANGWSGIGYHFYITKTGKIYKGRPENAIGAHAKNFNRDSLGIAVEGRYTNETMPAAQRQAVIKLGQYLRQKYNIEKIYKHSEVTPTNCPGKNYPYSTVKSEILKSLLKPNGIYEWNKVNGKWYYMDPWTLDKKKGWIKDNGADYYLDNNGVMVTGWKTIDNRTYYFKSNGEMAKGWEKINDIWYYFNKEGQYETGWNFINNKWYYLDSYGRMKIGWLKYKDKWYYLRDNGEMATKWIKDEGKWYYLNENGRMLTGWKEIDNNWYHLKGNGEMSIGFLDYKENKYYLDKSGKMALGWREIDKKWYHFDKDGEMNTEWLRRKGQWYYLSKETGEMLTGWQEVREKWYYLNEDGHMASNTMISGIRIGEDGAAKL